MAILGRFIQTPTERKKYTVNYTDWLAAGESIISFAYSSVPASPTPARIDAYSITSPTVPIYISGGVDGTQYKILITATTSLGQIKNDEVVIVVKAL